MPKVGSKHYPYTKKGKQAARAARISQIRKKKGRGSKKSYGY